MKAEMMNLIRKAKDRDPNAFTTLMQQQMKDMYRVAIDILLNDEDAAIAIQETILSCWERIGTVEQGAGCNKMIMRNKEHTKKVLRNICFSELFISIL